MIRGQRFLPVEAVGAYSPGGLFPLIASAIMTVVTPKVAEVPRIGSCAHRVVVTACIIRYRWVTDDALETPDIEEAIEVLGSL